MVGGLVWFETLELCLDITCLMFGIVLYDTLKVFLLIIQFNLWSGGKELSMASNALRATFVLTSIEYVIFRFL